MRLSNLRYLIKYMKDPNISKWQKIFLILLMVYVVSPLDLIPEPIFGVGIIDDLIMMAYIWSHFLPKMSRYEKQTKKDAIIVDYEINDED